MDLNISINIYINIPCFDFYQTHIFLIYFYKKFNKLNSLNDKSASEKPKKLTKQEVESIKKVKETQIRSSEPVKKC